MEEIEIVFIARQKRFEVSISCVLFGGMDVTDKTIHFDILCF